MSEEEPLYDTDPQRRAYEAGLSPCQTCGARRSVDWVPAGGFGDEARNREHQPGKPYCTNRDCETRWAQ